MSQKFGAVAKPVDGHLVLNSEMSGKSVSGKNLPLKYIDASDVASYSCSFKETESTGGTTGTIFANWYDKNTGEYHLVHVGDGDPETELQEIFSSEKEALAAAQSKFKRVTKNNHSFRFSVAGRPDLFAEGSIELRGFPDKIPMKWIMTRVEHQQNSSGFVTNVDCCLS